jgi:hypothetical protein
MERGHFQQQIRMVGCGLGVIETACEQRENREKEMRLVLHVETSRGAPDAPSEPRAKDRPKQTPQRRLHISSTN